MVQKGDRIKICPVDAKDKKVVFEKVLMVAKDKDDVALGTPYLESAKVEGSLITSGKEKKIRVYKMKSKKRYRRTYGHRQPYMEIEITKIAS